MTRQSRGKTAKTAIFQNRWQAWQVVRSIAAVRQRPTTPRNWRCSFTFSSLSFDISMKNSVERWSSDVQGPFRVKMRKMALGSNALSTLPLIPTYDGAKVTVSPGLKGKAPGAVTARVPALTLLVEIFTSPAPIDWTQEATMVKVRFFFYHRGSFKCSIGNLPTFWRGAPALQFSWQLARYVSLAMVLVHSYRRSLDEDGRSLWVGTWGSSFPAILRPVWLFFPPGAPVRSFLSQPISTAVPVALTFNKTKPALSSIAVVTKVIKRTDRTSLCCIWEHPQRCFPPIGTKTVRSIEQLFSQWTRPKRANSDQRTDEEDTSETCNNNHVGGRALPNA